MICQEQDRKPHSENNFIMHSNASSKVIVRGASKETLAAPFFASWHCCRRKLQNRCTPCPGTAIHSTTGRLRPQHEQSSCTHAAAEGGAALQHAIMFCHSIMPSDAAHTTTGQQKHRRCSMLQAECLPSLHSKSIGPWHRTHIRSTAPYAQQASALYTIGAPDPGQEQYVPAMLQHATSSRRRCGLHCVHQVAALLSLLHQHIASLQSAGPAAAAVSGAMAASQHLGAPGALQAKSTAPSTLTP